MPAKVKKEGVVRKGSAFFLLARDGVVLLSRKAITFSKTISLAKTAKIAKKAKFNRGYALYSRKDRRARRETRNQQGKPFFAILAIFARVMAFFAGLAVFAREMVFREE